MSEEADSTPKQADVKFHDHVKSVCLSTFIGFLLEVPALILAAVFIDLKSCGRKLTTNLGSIAGGVCCLAVFVLAQIKSVGALPLQIIATIGRLLYSGAFLVLYIYSSEICPTSLRSSLLGLCSMFARLSGMLAPITVQFLESLFEGASFLNFFVFTCGSFSASYIYLPETLGWALQPDIKTLKDSHDRGELGLTLSFEPETTTGGDIELSESPSAIQEDITDAGISRDARGTGAVGGDEMFDPRFTLKEKTGRRGRRYSQLEDDPAISSSGSDY
eukprot:Selendium_serpulae@DN3242_c0_g1_i3.p1